MAIEQLSPCGTRYQLPVPHHLAQKLEQHGRMGDCAEHPALHLDHFDRVLVVRPVDGAAAVFE